MDNRMQFCTNNDEIVKKGNEMHNENLHEIEIEMEDGKIEKISFNEKEDPEIVAENFCSMKQINSNLYRIFKQLIALKIKNFLISLSNKNYKEINMEENIMEEQKIPKIIPTKRTERLLGSDYANKKNDEHSDIENEKVNSWKMVDNWESPSFTSHKPITPHDSKKKQTINTTQSSFSNLSCMVTTNSIDINFGDTNTNTNSNFNNFNFNNFKKHKGNSKTQNKITNLKVVRKAKENKKHLSLSIYPTQSIQKFKKNEEIKIEDHLIQTGRLYEKNKHYKKLEAQSNYKSLKSKSKLKFKKKSLSINSNLKESTSRKRPSKSKKIQLRNGKSTLNIPSEFTKSQKNREAFNHSKSLIPKNPFCAKEKENEKEKEKEKNDSENGLSVKTINNSPTKLSIMTDHLEMMSTIDEFRKRTTLNQNLKTNSPGYSLLHKDELIIQDLYNFIYTKSHRNKSKEENKIEKKMKKLNILFPNLIVNSKIPLKQLSKVAFYKNAQKIYKNMNKETKTALKNILNSPKNLEKESEINSKSIYSQKNKFKLEEKISEYQKLKSKKKEIYTEILMLKKLISNPTA